MFSPAATLVSFVPDSRNIVKTGTTLQWHCGLISNEHYAVIYAQTLTFLVPPKHPQDYHFLRHKLTQKEDHIRVIS
jgi:hypothetical protein